MSDRAYETLRDRLLTLEIAPGDPIEEDILRGELHMGRTPIREAIRRLALEQLIDIFPRRGTFASDIHITDLAAISEVRRDIEGAAAALAAKRLVAADEAALDDLLARLQALEDGGAARDKMDVDSEVHRFVYSCTRNSYLESTLTLHFNLSMRIWHFVLDRLPDTYSVEEHRELLEAIRAHDAEQARKIAMRHVDDFAQAVRAVL